jgi:hypothetical protein
MQIADLAKITGADSGQRTGAPTGACAIGGGVGAGVAARIVVRLKPGLSQAEKVTPRANPKSKPGTGEGRGSVFFESKRAAAESIIGLGSRKIPNQKSRCAKLILALLFTLPWIIGAKTPNCPTGLTLDELSIPLRQPFDPMLLGLGE